MERSGYGELIISVVVAFLLPQYSFVLQVGEIDRIVAMCGFPLVMIHLAMMLVFEFPSYIRDVKYHKSNMLVRLGWKGGINFHNLIIISAYLILIIELILGLPRMVVLHAFLSLPIAMLQFWQVVRIEHGEKPNWNSLKINALATFGAMAYFMFFALWKG